MRAASVQVLFCTRLSEVVAEVPRIDAPPWLATFAPGARERQAPFVSIPYGDPPPRVPGNARVNDMSVTRADMSANASGQSAHHVSEELPLGSHSRESSMRGPCFHGAGFAGGGRVSFLRSPGMGGLVAHPASNNSHAAPSQPEREPTCFARM